MPEESENTEQQEGAAPAKKGGSKLKLIIILVVLLIVLLVAGVVVYKFVLAPAPEEGAEAAAEGAAPAAAPVPAAPAAAAPAATSDIGMDPNMSSSTEMGTIYALPSFAVNLYDPNGVTYLKLGLSIEYDPKNKEIEAELVSKLPKVQDLIITLLSSKALEEIATAQGKVNLRSEILRRINAMMAKGKFFNIYITEFIVQRT